MPNEEGKKRSEKKKKKKGARSTSTKKSYFNSNANSEAMLVSVRRLGLAVVVLASLSMGFTALYVLGPAVFGP